MSGSSLRFIQLYQTLHPKEIKQFRAYIDSPYFNTNQRLVKLIDYLEHYNPEKEGEIDKEAIFAVLYEKDATYNEQQVYDHFSFLLRLLENFLAQQDYENDFPSRQRHLLSALTLRDHEPHFQRSFQKAEKKWKQHPYRDANYYLWRFLQFKEGSEFSGKQQKRTDDDYLVQAIYSLDLGYLSFRLKYACELLNRENILGDSSSESVVSWPADLLTQIPESFRDIPVIQIYTQIYLTLQEPLHEKHYHELVKLLNTHTQEFPKREVNDMYTYAQNYCIKMINSGNARYEQHLFSLFQNLLDKELLIENGVIDHRKYKNIITVGLRMKEYNWVKDFLDQYRKYLPEKFQGNAYHYNLASYFYEQDEYSQALQLLNQISFSDVYYHLSSRAMILKIYYEMEEENALDSLLDTFRIFLNRNKNISAYQRTVHKNLIRYTRKLNQIRNQSGVLTEEQLGEKLRQLVLEMEKKASVANINWLKEKAEQLGNGFLIEKI
ncbi:MAG: hypothetical protein R3B93_20660 [Bacteroidia bacterium]